MTMFKAWLLFIGIAIASSERDVRRLPDPPPPTEPFVEVSSEKCDVVKNNYCGTLDGSNPQHQYNNGK